MFESKDLQHTTMDIGLPLIALVLLAFILSVKKLFSIRKTKPWIFWGTLFLFFFLFIFGANEFLRRKIGGFAGSYPHVESWEIKAREEEIIEAIKELSKTNPNFQPPNEYELITERDTGYIWNSFEMEQYLEKLKTDSLTPLPVKTFNNYYHDYWLFLRFYYPDTREYVHAWTRPEFNKKHTTLAFVSLSRVDDPLTHRLINRDFWFVPNRIQINKFESTFVDKIKEQLEKNRNKEKSSN